MDPNALITCPNCGAGNRGEARFCQKCGTELLPPSAPAAPSQVRQPPSSQGNILNDIFDEIEDMADDVRASFSSLARKLLGDNKQAPDRRTIPTPQSTNSHPPVNPQPGLQQQPHENQYRTDGLPRQDKPALSNRLTAPTRMVSYLIAPKAVGEVVGGYVILESWPLQRSNYYRVRMEHCPQGHANPGALAERCSTCQAELGVYLMRETDLSLLGMLATTVEISGPAVSNATVPPNELSRSQPQVSRSVDKQNIATLTQLSRSGVPGFLKLAAVFDTGGRRYAVSDYPGQGWQSLIQLSLPVTDHLLIIHWVQTLGQVLLKLGEAGFAPEPTSLADVFEPVVVLASTTANHHPMPSGAQIAFADLGIFTRRALPEAAPSATSGPAAVTLNPQVAFLGQVLYSLASGKQLSRSQAPRDYSDVPAPFRGVIAHLDQNAYPSLPAFLETLREIQVLPDSAQGQERSLRQIAGYSTNNGRKRDHNEDFVGKYSLGMQQAADAPEVGLYLVADGMGGHQAGELASREVVRVILNEIQENVQELQSAPKLKRSTIKVDQIVSVGDILKRAVQRANEILFNAKQKIGSDRGTTLTSALVIGDLCSVANVGDSRTYLWRESKLSQITRDHSLVASLLAANMIRPDEVRSHPQRNKVYRTLGEQATVEVDLFDCPLRQGDRLILCSDGLWEMVLDQEIQQIIKQSSNPQEACDRLIEAANLAGGEDNISVVSVWMA